MAWPLIAKIGATVGSSLLTSAFNARSVHDTNKSNEHSARRQMAFQERMSSSAHQREMQDLKKAGLNPMLSYSGSGASSPSGAMSVSSASQASNPLDGMDELLMNEEKTHQMGVQNEKLKVDIVNQGANTENTIQNTKTGESTQQLLNMKTLREAQKIQLDKNRADFENSTMGKYRHYIDTGLGWGSSALNMTKGGKALLDKTSKIGGQNSAKQNETNNNHYKKLTREQQDERANILRRHDIR